MAQGALSFSTGHSPPGIPHQGRDLGVVPIFMLGLNIFKQNYRANTGQFTSVKLWERPK